MTVYFSTCSEWCIVFQWEFKFIGGQSNNLKEKSNDTNNVKIQACKMLKEKFFPPRVVNYLRREEGKAKSEWEHTEIKKIFKE